MSLDKNVNTQQINFPYISNHAKNVDHVQLYLIYWFLTKSEVTIYKKDYNIKDYIRWTIWKQIFTIKKIC